MPFVGQYNPSGGKIKLLSIWLVEWEMKVGTNKEIFMLKKEGNCQFYFDIVDLITINICWHVGTYVTASTYVNN